MYATGLFQFHVEGSFFLGKVSTVYEQMVFAEATTVCPDASYAYHKGDWKTGNVTAGRIFSKIRDQQSENKKGGSAAANPPFSFQNTSHLTY